MKWEPIESAPLDGSCVLVWNGDYIALAFWNRNYKTWADLTDQGAEENEFSDPPTHWMPLPESPDEPRYTITEAGRAMLRDAQQSSPDRQQGE